LLCLFVKTKDATLNTFKIYKTEVENKIEKNIKRFISDRGGEYLSNEFDLFYAEHDIIYEMTPPYSPQSNGVVKRKNHTLIDLINSMLENVGLSKAWWGGGGIDFMSCPVINRVPMKNKRRLHMKNGLGENVHYLIY
jgi:transposase InsO family protein